MRVHAAGGTVPTTKLAELTFPSRHLYACFSTGASSATSGARLTENQSRRSVSRARRTSMHGTGPPENMTRIFNHGFTTRKNGHGFGLHSGALAARELGGRLLAHSDGIGCGATFTLELPVVPERK